MAVVLPAPLGPRKPKHLAARHVEVDAVEGAHVAVRLHEALESDCRCVAHGHRANLVTAAGLPLAAKAFQSVTAYQSKPDGFDSLFSLRDRSVHASKAPNIVSRADADSGRK